MASRTRAPLSRCLMRMHDSGQALLEFTLSLPVMNLTKSGRVIVSAVYNNNNVMKLTGQATLGGFTAVSRVGSVIGGTAKLPTSAAPQLNQTVYVTEVFYSFHAITPIGNFLSKAFLPTQLYDVAYY